MRCCWAEWCWFYFVVATFTNTWLPQAVPVEAVCMPHLSCFLHQHTTPRPTMRRMQRT